MAELSEGERSAMHVLLTRYFENVTADRFAADLAEKESVLLLYRDGILGGFSTLMRLEAEVDGTQVMAFFSGDTVVAPAFQGYSELSRLWSRHTFARAAELRRRRPELRIYWLLISAGYKTYRFLPLFFRRYFPAPGGSAGSERRVAQALAAAKFGAEYLPELGVVRFRAPSPLRPGVAEIGAGRRRDPHVSFFLQANPGHARGDELVCLAEVHPDNLTPAGARMLGGARR